MPVQSTIFNIDRQQVFDPRLYQIEDSHFKPIRKSIRFATSPHLMHYMDGAYLAINRCLTIEAQFVEKEDHKITFIGPDPPTGIEEIIKYAFSVFRASYRYELVISDLYDFEGNVAYTALIACLLEIVIKFEEKAIREITTHQWIFNVLYKFEIAPESPKAIRQAVLNGGLSEAYLEPAAGKEVVDRNVYNHIPYIPFKQDYDVFFVRTNLHPSNFKKSLKPDRKRFDYLIENFHQRSNFPTCISAYWKERMTHEDCTELQIECDAAIQDYQDNNQDGPTIHGFESQQGGLLLVVSKKCFENEDFLMTLSLKLSEHCDEEVTQVSFDHLEPGLPVRIIEPTKQIGTAKVNKIVFHLKPTEEYVSELISKVKVEIDELD